MRVPQAHLLGALALVGVLAAGASAQNRYVAICNGANEVPPVTTTATGTGVMTVDSANAFTINVETAGMTGTACHVHTGAAGATGGVAIPLTGGPSSWSASGTLNATQLANLQSASLYVNVHSASAPGGEIRGQLVPPPIVINEFSYDDSSTDDHEYVEWYNRSSSPVDISGWILDSQDPFGSNNVFTVPASTTLAAGDYYVFGSANVPNVDQIVGTTNIWENSNESLSVCDSFAQMHDTLVYEANKGIWDPTLAEGEGVWGNKTTIAGIETSWSRLRDGNDNDDNGCDFRLASWTPGTSNTLGEMCERKFNYDGIASGTRLTEWGGSFKAPAVIDPTVVSAINPNAIAASPQGGNAMICWDESGGGNSGMYLTDGASAAAAEAYVYFDATLAASGERQVWSFGFGATGTFFNFPDPSGAAGFTANGDAGICWTYEVTDTAATLYLVDNNNGGTDHTVLGSVVVTTSGWQRLLVAFDGTTFEGRFGGTFGQADGTHFSGANSCGTDLGLFVGFREGYSTNANTRPFTCDCLQVAAVGSEVIAVEYGNGSPNSSGSTPTIGAGGAKCDTLQVSGMNPGAVGVLVIGASKTVFDLTLIGGPPGTILHVAPVTTALISADANGDFSIGTTMANTSSGVQLFFQVIEVDFAIVAALPVGHTAGLDMKRN